jgi:uncharacterized protein with NRDE domain
VSVYGGSGDLILRSVAGVRTDGPSHLMCLIALAHRAHPAYRLVVAANRDEFRARPTAPAAWWADAPSVLAGRDLLAGGTWLGVTRSGRFAALTNFREWPPEDGERSRGALVAEFLRGRGDPAGFAAVVAGEGARYAGFNLLVGDGDTLVYVSNRVPGFRLLEPGVYALGNHLLDTPWPKVLLARHAMEGALTRADGRGWDAGLWRMLADRVAAADPALPDTGVGAERERILSAAFIEGEEYGTRSSTVLAVAAGGDVTMVERTFAPGAAAAEVRHAFRAASA